MQADAILPDVLAPGLRLVLCGSAAGTRSAQVGAYYAGPGNRFWPLLWRLGLTPRQLAPDEFGDVLAYGIGLTDLAKTVSGPDAHLAKGSDDPQGLRRRIRVCEPAILAFNGKRPAEAYLRRKAAFGLQPETIGPTRIFVLPSTSRANARFTEHPWHDLAALLASLRGSGQNTEPAARSR